MGTGTAAGKQRRQKLISENPEHGFQLGCSQRGLQGLVWDRKRGSMKRGRAGTDQVLQPHVKPKVWLPTV